MYILVRNETIIMSNPNNWGPIRAASKPGDDIYNVIHKSHVGNNGAEQVVYAQVMPSGEDAFWNALGQG